MTTAANWEHVADVLSEGGGEPPERVMDDPQEARDRIAGYLMRRTEAISAACGGDATLMLSGGVDSMLLAATWKRCGLAPLCVTVSAEGFPSDDRDRAAAAAAYLGLAHHAVELTSREVRHLAAEAVGLLDVDEMWEIGAAVPIMAVRDAATRAGRGGPIISGAGADVLFAGGMRLAAPATSRAAAAELRSRVWAAMLSAFCRDRLVPDFFERVLGQDSLRFFEVFQTVEAWRLTSDFAPTLLFAHDADGRLVDKMCLRDLAAEWGADPAQVWAPKSPMQFSSGVVQAFAALARQTIREDPAQSTYSDPRAEPPEHLMVRLWLKHLRSSAPA